MKKQQQKKAPSRMEKEKQVTKEPPAIMTKLPQTAPQKQALDLHLILGDDTSGQKLAQLSANFELKPERIQQLCTNSDLDFSTVGTDTILRFDFVTQEGRQKEAIQYFQNGLDRYPRDEYDPNLSPLQNWFSRPTHEGKLELFESKRRDGKKGVTLLYRLYSSQMQDIQELRDFLQKMEQSKFRPDAKLQMELRGHLDTFKKNRIRIRMDHISAHLTSNEFRLADLLDFMKILRVLGEDEELEEIINNPIFKLMQKSEEVQGTVRMASMRKMLELYKIGLENSSQQRVEKESPEIIKGLLKDEVRITFIYESKFGIAANFQYESESILIRLLSGLKKYSSLFD